MKFYECADEEQIRMTGSQKELEEGPKNLSFDHLWSQMLLIRSALRLWKVTIFNLCGVDEDEDGYSSKSYLVAVARVRRLETVTSINLITSSVALQR